ncbi:MAG: SHOCT domain-containing protein [Sulfurospirillaceae bacterium]|nr:SHOCT domain-containing protein [Sulfurospirillaceae bacterium]
MYGGGYAGGFGGHMMFFPGMGILLFIVVLILMYLFVNSFLTNRNNNNNRSTDNAIEILRNRYARGEISKEEYLSAKEILSK